MVFTEAQVRLANGPDQTRMQICSAIDKIQHLIRFRIEQQAIDREVTPQDILPGIGFETHRLRSTAIGIDSIAAKSRDLNRANQNHAEVCPHFFGSRENRQKLVRNGVGGNIEILRRAAQQDIANAAANQPRSMAFVP